MLLVSCLKPLFGLRSIIDQHKSIHVELTVGNVQTNEIKEGLVLFGNSLYIGSCHLFKRISYCEMGTAKQYNSGSCKLEVWIIGYQ